MSRDSRDFGDGVGQSGIHRKPDKAGEEELCLRTERTCNRWVEPSSVEALSTGGIRDADSIIMHTQLPEMHVAVFSE